MSHATAKSAYWEGLRAGLPFIIVASPFGFLFGVVATEAGLPLSQTMGMTLLVVAGAAQFTAIQFMTENAPILIVVVSALAVNLRMAMYSAALTPHIGAAPTKQRLLLAFFLVDQAYALSFNEYENNPERKLSEKVAYYFGSATPICPIWYLFSYIGAVVGEAIPAEFGLDYIVPITFLAMVAPALKSVAHIAAAATSIIVALLLVWVPFNLGLMVAAIIAMMVGAEIERRRA